MKRMLMEFVSLTALLFLLNLISNIAGILFVDGYSSYLYGHINVVDELLMISVFVSPFLLLAIRYYKKGGIVIYSIVNMLWGSFCLHKDTFGYGGEFLSSLVFSVSKFNHLISVIIAPGHWQIMNLTIIWGCYIALVGYLYLYLRERMIGRLTMNKKDLSEK